jgi:hypothetical protein
MTDHKYDLANEAEQITISLDGDSGDVIMKDAAGKERIRMGRVQEYGGSPGGGGKKKGGGTGTTPSLVADYWGFRVKNAKGTSVMQLGRHAALSGQVAAAFGDDMPISLSLGGGGTDGVMTLLGSDGKMLISLNGATGQVSIGDPKGQERFHLSGTTGDVSLGGHGVDGDLSLKSGAGNPVVLLNAGDGDAVQVRDESSKKKIVFAFDKNAWGSTRAGLFLGAHSTQGGKKPGLIAIRDDAGNDGVTVSGSASDDNIAVDEPGKRLLAFAKNALIGKKKRAGLFIGAHVSQGGKKAGFVAVRDDAGNDSVVIDGAAGDIVLANADCAERFDVAEGGVEPGTVMVIGQGGALAPSSEPYDRRVAGIVSGAGEHRPGIVLDAIDRGNPRRPVALVGKVFCKVDARYGTICVGDLLTTSLTVGHAMKAADHRRAVGAIIGKALRPLDGGVGLIPVLVALQ